MSRHANILNIFLTQDYTAIPSRIWRNCNLVVLLTMDNYSESMAKENSLKNRYSEFQKFYEDNVINRKDHSFIVVDKSAQIDKRYIFYDAKKQQFEYVDIFKNVSPHQKWIGSLEESKSLDSQENEEV